MRQQCPVFDGDGAAQRLTELGLTTEILEFVLRGADAEARAYTPLDPPNMQGMARYARTVRLLRERLVPLGWSYDNPRNLARTVSPDRRVAIITTLGDGATGVPHVMPSTRYEKGIATVEAVGRNFLQLSLPIDLGDLGDDGPLDVEDDATATWILLYNVTDTEIRAELSLPDSMVDGYIDTWVERLVLPPIPLEPAIDLTAPKTSAAPRGIVPGPRVAALAPRADEPDVLVTRRFA
ncbi:hypothetical protein GCM10023322_52980 [Rugosimonospora acidiphila]|uniref:Uncharacterized protein n=1 Tax=Rugosimonospora acidiphila TaxID=556531 RepID=A0ABP9S9B6_9ACTN